MKDVVAEITAENLEPKKRFRGRGPREDAGGVAGAGSRGGEADQAAERLAGGPNAFGVGREPDDVLPLAAAAALRVAEGLSGPPPQPVQPYEALPEEKAAVREYALKHPELRHRELAWRMVDEDVAYLGASTV